MKSEGTASIAVNRKAFHDYFIHDKYEAGVSLTGTEVKSVRSGRANLKDSFARIDARGEIWLWNAHISPYEQGNRFNHDPLRTRKLLMHRSEIRKLQIAVKEKGFTLVPLRLYFRHGLVKCEIAVASGKKLYDKRQDMIKKATDRELDRRMKERRFN